MSILRFLREWLGLALQLGRIKVTIAVTLTTATGFLLFARRLDADTLPDFLLVVAGVFCAAAGASALNQVQEVGIDRRMQRTQKRPLPTGRIDRIEALFIVFLYLAAAFNLLAYVSHWTGSVLLLTAFTMLWYNVVYTLLKRWTAFAVAPGALVGALPPAIGWCAAGGSLADPTIHLFAFFMFIWQLPHFWLLLLLHGKDYEAAGLPSATALFGPRQLGRITFVWVLATITTGLLLATAIGLRLPWNIAFVVASIWVMAKGFQLLARVPRPRWEIATFMQLNLYALIAMVLVIGNAMV